VKALFTYLTGGRSGQAVTLEKSYALLGRAPHADVRFGPDHDLVVSARHAAVVFRAGNWVLRDLASTNGTFVNGVKVEGEHTLGDQDLIRLGDGGPLLRFGVLQESWAPPSVAPSAAGDLTEPGELGATDEAAVLPSPPLPAVPRTPIAVPWDESAPAPRQAPPRRRPVGLLLAVGLAALTVAILLTRRDPIAATPPSAERRALITDLDNLFRGLEERRKDPLAPVDEITALMAETARLRSRARRVENAAETPALRTTLDSLEARAQSLGD
jgi:predicted component of type VI protein secretion system